MIATCYASIVDDNIRLRTTHYNLNTVCCFLITTICTLCLDFIVHRFPTILNKSFVNWCFNCLKIILHIQFVIMRVILYYLNMQKKCVRVIYKYFRCKVHDALHMTEVYLSQSNTKISVWNYLFCNIRYCPTQHFIWNIYVTK